MDDNQKSVRCPRAPSFLWPMLFLMVLSLSTRGQLSYDFNLATTSAVYTLAVQADNKILVDSVWSPFRLHSDGSMDGTFSAQPNRYGKVYTVAVQADGRVLCGGEYTSLSGELRTNLARINPEGTFDASFGRLTGGPPGFPAGWILFALATQLDGKILIGGEFSNLNGAPYNGVGRLDPDGSVDTTFGHDLEGIPFSLAVQPDGKILVGGWLRSAAGSTHSNLCRLNADGTLDAAFQPIGIEMVDCFAGQADGKIVAGGGFDQPAPAGRSFIRRFNPDGSADASFAPVFDSAVYSIAVQADGRLVVGGVFTNLNGALCRGLCRLNPDGSGDPSFAPPAYASVHSLALQPDGKILVGGQLEALNGSRSWYVGRIPNTAPAPQALACDGSTITWLRGGTSPELWFTQFQLSTNGVDWSDLGTGTRIPGGWQLTGLAVPPGSAVRALGSVSVGQYNGTSYYVQAQTTSGVVLAPVIITQPGDLTTFDYTAAAFTVLAGVEPLAYQWRRDGTNLAGATGSRLAFENLQPADGGGYEVVVSNSSGSVTSRVAALTVRLRPTITEAGIAWGNQYRFQVTAEHCQQVVVQASGDLQHWTNVLYRSIGLESRVSFLVSDLLSPATPARFYRVLQE